MTLRADDAPVLGELSDEKLTEKLAELGQVRGDLEDASIEEFATRKSPAREIAFFSREKPYLYTSHAFGYLAPAGNGKLVPAGQITPDKTLTRVSLRLNALRCASYPGDGIHQVLFDFYAENHVSGTIESAHFNQVYRINEGQSAGIIGYPIFTGINVGKSGIAFRCFTVNVKNDDDEAFLGFLDSDVFKQGLKLASVAQPAIAPFSTMAVGMAKAIGARHRNFKVQDFYMGLDLDNNTAGARLAVGDYFAVQIPDRITADWDWAAWVFDSSKSTVVSASDHKTLLPYNYVGFGVSRYDD
ncbi:MAG TPA: hypothetical protein VGJ81_09890 [Thermoanaerobaculia bacterium]|jgi:hypothetical protein